MLIKSGTIIITLRLAGILTGCNSIANEASSEIAVQSFTPKPIEITLDDLPEPFATESARKPPNVIPVPDNPVLQVPEGFSVNVFADNLPDVRWMTLTPEGDVLAVQSRQNKINLLQDRDRNGVAEVIELFGDRNNNLDQPLGMTFAGDSFYVANTGEVLQYQYQSGQLKLEGTGKEITKLTPGGYKCAAKRTVVMLKES